MSSASVFFLGLKTFIYGTPCWGCVFVVVHSIYMKILRHEPHVGIGLQLHQRLSNLSCLSRSKHALSAGFATAHLTNAQNMPCPPALTNAHQCLQHCAGMMDFMFQTSQKMVWLLFNHSPQKNSYLVAQLCVYVYMLLLVNGATNYISPQHTIPAVII